MKRALLITGITAAILALSLVAFRMLDRAAGTLANRIITRASNTIATQRASSPSLSPATNTRMERVLAEEDRTLFRLYEYDTARDLVITAAPLLEAAIEKSIESQIAIEVARRIRENTKAPVAPQKTNERTTATELSFLFTGDIMTGTDYPSPEFLPPAWLREHVIPSSIANIIRRADLAIGNLEGVIANRTTVSAKGGYSNAYSFRMPPHTAEYLAGAGFDVMTVANNHAMDFGYEGFCQTTNNLARAGLTVAGVKNEAARVTVKGVRVIIVGFATASRYYNTVKAYNESMNIIRTYAKEADILIVTFHAGAEGNDNYRVRKRSEYFFGEDRGNVYYFARRAVRAGADIVIGHGPHVLRGMELYRGKLIAYSLGNFVGYRMFSVHGRKGVSAFLSLTVDAEGNAKRGVVYPIRLAEETIRRGIPHLTTSSYTLRMLERINERDFPLSGISFIRQKGYEEKSAYAKGVFTITRETYADAEHTNEYPPPRPPR